MILLYVDDLIIAASKNSIHNLETSISEIFVDTKLTIQNLDYYLGIKIRTLHEGKLISLHQTEYVDSVYEKYSYLLSNVDSNATTPLTKEAVEYTKAQIDPDANQHLEEDMSDSHDTFPYRELVGSLLYLCTCTRPDISYAIGFLTRGVCKPTQIHKRASLHLLSHLKLTRTHSLLIYGQSTTVTGFSDASWLNSMISRKSDHAFVIYSGNSPIYWRFCHQMIISLSTAEAEYDALTSMGKEAMWLKSLIEDIFGPQKLPSILYIDNEAAIRISQHPTVHTNSRHFQLRAHWMRYNVSQQVFTVQHIGTKHIAADAMTKSLSLPEHNRHSLFLRGHIQIKHPTTQQWRDIFEGEFKLKLNEYYSLDDETQTQVIH